MTPSIRRSRVVRMLVIAMTSRGPERRRDAQSRKNLKKPSPHCSERERKAEQTDGPVRHHAGKHEGNAERKDHGPGGGRGELDGAGHGSMLALRRVSLNAVGVLPWFPALLKFICLVRTRPEDGHPDGVHKVPIERKHFEPLRVSFLYAPAQGDRERD